LPAITETANPTDKSAIDVGLPPPEIPSLAKRLTNSALWASLLCSMTVWLVSIQVPLWLDETISYWQTQGGFRQLWDRQGSIQFVAYPFFLWATKSLFGSSLVALRAPSVLAMIGATVFLYHIAREFFDRDVSLIVTTIFCLHPIVIFAAIDARSYAMGLLACTAATYFLLRWMRTHNTRDAILFGLTAGLIAWFQYLFVVILGAFLLILLSARPWWKSFPAQLLKALTIFIVTMLPIAFRFLLLVHTRQSHVLELAPVPANLLETFAPGNMFLFLGGVLLLAIAMRKFPRPSTTTGSAIANCVLLGFVPLLALYLISTLTPIHIFTLRYRLVAIPGIALCWGVLLSRINSNPVRLLFTMALVLTVAKAQIDAPAHGHSWKGATEAVNAATLLDHAPVLVCSNLVESDFEPMPTKDVSESWLFSQFTYYKISTPIVPLPRTLNPRTQTLVRDFLRTAAPAHQRFFAMGHGDSVMVLHWIGTQLKDSYTARDVGQYDGVLVVEYQPK